VSTPACGRPAGSSACSKAIRPPLGQRAGLVGEEHLDVAEILDRDESLDDHRPLHEPASAGREADGDDRRQQLRRHADRDGEREEQRLEQRAAEEGVEDEDRARQEAGDDHEHARVVLQPPLEGSLLVPLPEPQRDPAESGPRPRLHHDAAPLAATDDSAHERTRGQVERRVSVAWRRRLHSHRRLTGEHRLVALEAIRLGQPQVGRHDVTHPQANHVPGHQSHDVDLLRPPVALDERRAADLGVQRLDRLLGAVLVDEAEPDAQTDDREDDRSVRLLADEG
jgi:hypothetical protein